jgi:TPR repeat protein
MQVVELRVAKRDKDAVELLRGLVAEGDLGARVAMARSWEAAGLARDEADRIVDTAHTAVRPDDVVAHLELYGAYAQGLGAVGYDVQARRSFEHLATAAEHNAGPNYSLKVARMLWMGALAVPRDVDLATQWYERAAFQGSQEALQELKALKAELLGRPPPRAR